MTIKIITASQRADSASKKIGEHLASKLDNAEVVCLFEQNFPLWNVDKHSDENKWQNWKNLSKELTAAEGFIFVIPEYNGMMPAIINNFFLLADNQELAHKPALLVGVSAGPNGAYPIAEARSYSYKNSKINYIPDHLIIRNVNDFLENGNSHLDERIDYTLNIFLEYTKALKQVRDSGVTTTDKFKFGM